MNIFDRKGIPGINNSSWVEMSAAGLFDAIKVNYRFAEAVLNTGMRSFWPYAATQQFKLPVAAAKVVLECTNANDTAAGTGAQEITFRGYTAAGEMFMESLETNGLSDSAESVRDYIFVDQAFVSRSGTRPTEVGQYSIAGSVLVKRADNGDVLSYIDGEGNAKYAQTQQIFHVVPANHVFIVKMLDVRVESSKVTDFYLWKLTNPFAGAATPTNSIIRNVFELKDVRENSSPNNDLNIAIEGPAIVFATAKNAATSGEASCLLGYRVVDKAFFG